MDQQRQLISHLLRRAGFGGTPAELDQYAQLGYQGAVEQLLNFEQTPDDYPAYDASADPAKGRRGIGQLQLWWLNRMLTTKRPLQEKMTLFWHGHFATAVSKVNQAGWLYNQNQLFRQNALGPFQTMLTAVSKDPAMMFFLDSQTNRRGAPNENYGREVMELFTMGVGSYTEQDVKEGARALTGWTVKRDSDTSQFVPARFDDGDKSYLGHSGNLGLDDVVSILAGSPNTAKFLGRKLARFFTSDNPDDGTVGAIANTFATSNGDMKAVMRTDLNSDAFRDPGNFMNKITSPAEYVITNLKLLGAKSVDQSVLAAMRNMGQEVFNPPNVAGWPGNRSWLNTDTIFTRLNFADRIVSNRATDGPTYVDPSAILGGASDAIGRFVDLLTDGFVADANRQVLQDYFSGAAKAADAKLRGLVHLILSTPTAHLN
ncbi:MAG TPA: DUF1800 domain-containing protein [Chloroflexota bacterium]|jgi:uncharacterized protein (DUF1800 family)